MPVGVPVGVPVGRVEGGRGPLNARDDGARLMRGAIRGTKSSSEAIRGHQSPSEAIRAHQEAASLSGLARNGALASWSLCSTALLSASERK